MLTVDLLAILKGIIGMPAFWQTIEWFLILKETLIGWWQLFSMNLELSTFALWVPIENMTTSMRPPSDWSLKIWTFSLSKRKMITKQRWRR